MFPLVAVKGRGYPVETIFDELRHARLVYELPRQVLPFGMCGGDVPLFLDLTADGGGRVVVYLRGLPEWAGKRQTSAFVEVAGSFDEFLRQLRLDEKECIECLVNALESGNVQAIAYGTSFLDLALPQWRMTYGELVNRTLQ